MVITLLGDGFFIAPWKGEGLDRRAALEFSWVWTSTVQTVHVYSPLIRVGRGGRRRRHRLMAVRIEEAPAPLEPTMKRTNTRKKVRVGHMPRPK